MRASQFIDVHAWVDGCGVLRCSSLAALAQRSTGQHAGPDRLGKSSLRYLILSGPVSILRGGQPRQNFPDEARPVTGFPTRRIPIPIPAQHRSSSPQTPPSRSAIPDSLDGPPPNSQWGTIPSHYPQDTLQKHGISHFGPPKQSPAQPFATPRFALATHHLRRPRKAKTRER